jgi:predicted lipid-binding transport protein (Tim44 family)
MRQRVLTNPMASSNSSGTPDSTEAAWKAALTEPAAEDWLGTAAHVSCGMKAATTTKAKKPLNRVDFADRARKFLTTIETPLPASSPQPDSPGRSAW